MQDDIERDAAWTRLDIGVRGTPFPVIQQNVIFTSSLIRLPTSQNRDCETRSFSGSDRSTRVSTPGKSNFSLLVKSPTYKQFSLIQ